MRLLFVVLFTFGGFTGVILANNVVNVVLHDTYFVVAHFHYVLSLGAATGVFARLYYWLAPLFLLKIHKGFRYVHIFLYFLGVNMAFYPMHAVGMRGMPRRVNEYSIFFYERNYLSSLG